MDENTFNRLGEERGQVQSRITNLSLFMFRDEFKELPKVERKLLKKQLKHMEKYSDVLYDRIKRHE